MTTRFLTTLSVALVAIGFAADGVPLACAQQARDVHRERNPVFRELLEVGVTSGDLTQQLPPPTLPDGLSDKEQIAVIEELGGTRYPFDKLTRKSVVAPNIIRVPRVPQSDAAAPLRTVDFWFVVFADLDAVADPDVLARLLGTQQDEGRAHGLTTEELAARGIVIVDDTVDQEAFGHLVYDLLGKVRISATGRSFWSRSDESIVAAVNVDRRFLEDDEFPNRWRRIERGGQERAFGPPHAYDGLGFYIKITRMHQPDGALLFEFHLVFAEPVAWFRGTNQLGAKFPAIVQSQVRAARREMMLVSRQTPSNR